MKITPKLLKFMLNVWPPYLGAGIRTNYISEDWMELQVSLKLHWFNRNVIGTHFGGSLFAMVDSHPMLQLINLLGKDYIVLDKSGNIEYIKATKKKVTSKIKLTDNVLEEIKRNTDNGEKYHSEFSIEIKDEDDETVANVHKIIYVRKKV